MPGTIPKECQCPGVPTGNKFANTCSFDQRIDGVVCNCQEGYVGKSLIKKIYSNKTLFKQKCFIKGNRCDKCATNYYGNPTEKGGSCKICECNGNTDVNDPSSCDQVTGQCKKCRYFTDGDHCEKCLPGYYGDALIHQCIRKSFK